MLGVININNKYEIVFEKSSYGHIKKDGLLAYYFFVGYDDTLYLSKEKEVKSGTVAHDIPKYIKRKIVAINRKIKNKKVKYVIVNINNNNDYWNNELGWTDKIGLADKFDSTNYNLPLDGSWNLY